MLTDKEQIKLLRAELILARKRAELAGDFLNATLNVVECFRQRLTQENLDTIPKDVFDKFQAARKTLAQFDEDGEI